LQAYRTITVEFPLGGLQRSNAYQWQAPFSTPLCKNVFPVDPATNRLRGGVRPVLKQLSSSGAPYHWTKVSYLDTTVKEGILICNANGTYSTLDGVTLTERIATNPASSFASCAYYNGRAYQATSGATCRQYTFAGGAEADLSNAGGGTAPTNCGLVWVHQDRLALAGKSDAPHQMFMAAVGDATDWDYSDVTVGGAWTNTGSEGGQLGDAVTAAINHGQNVSIVGSLRSMYAITGNPRVGGTKVIPSVVGPLSNNAWCKGIDDAGNSNTYMMTYDGLYVIPASNYMNPQGLSRKKIPNELIGVNPAAGDKCCIGFDSQWKGIYITVDPNSGSDVNFFYHIPTDSWWPLELPITPHVYATFPAVQSASTSAILPIGSAGSLRQFNNSESQGGSNENFDSFVLIGPIKLADSGGEGIITSCSAALAQGSEDVNWSIYVGDSAEQAYRKAEADTTNAAADFSGSKWTYTSTQYWNGVQNPRVRGSAAFIKVYDVSNERWQLEEIVMETERLGDRKVG
jgi:hypothetical protein